MYKKREHYFILILSFCAITPQIRATPPTPATTPDMLNNDNEMLCSCICDYGHYSPFQIILNPTEFLLANTQIMMVNQYNQERQMEVYRLEPNTTYEFRIWANNHLGAGEIVTTNVTTLSETKEEDLIRLIQADLDNFDPRIWIVAVSIVLGTLVILAIGLCIVLSKEYYQSSQMGTSTTTTSSTTNELDVVIA